LEYLVGAALAQDCQALVVGGRPDSNFVAAAAQAAAAAGLACHVVSAQADAQPVPPTANQRLAAAAGARIVPVIATGAGIDAAIHAHAATLPGRTYPVPRGGSTPVGALGFAAAAAELTAQLADLGVSGAQVVLAVGSGASCAGLLAGHRAGEPDWRLHGVSVSRPLSEIGPHVLDLARQAAGLRGWPCPGLEPLVLHDALAPGHGVPTAAQDALATAALRAEGLLLEATYLAKAFELAVQLARGSADPVVLWHTGGIAGALARLGTPVTEDGEPDR
jgi:D-cysteine desulfhydrase